jgi:hypothetical protein
MEQLIRKSIRKRQKRSSGGSRMFWDKVAGAVGKAVAVMRKRQA